MTRSFVALTLPDPALDQLEALQGQIPLGRRMTRETLHLTLAFLGEQPDEALVALHEELSQIRHSAFDLHMAGVGMYGNPNRLAMGVEADADSALTDLQSDVTKALRRAGLKFEKRRFRPHVTIARFKGEEPTDPRLHGFISGAMSYRATAVRITQFALYESHLSPGGARHDVLAAYPLG
ncbi:RNA 2',3'-cyclic phosphodiesterase [Actibacterium pelagium]|uniref:RNA 2',3'-cyclic phosphodiesterase n=1 Tax=Actibacterium pelagium TaxID=2029103 RepID=A0A917EGM4_9RHOB|nr:RNA 2',3'-cyclic phosphodiesterase [Actibacterium pelagium]GGE37405.1 RNA 2',3'-cyclic phosphodiesterase [Actibacterium pelagium]